MKRSPLALAALFAAVALSSPAFATGAPPPPPPVEEPPLKLQLQAQLQDQQQWQQQGQSTDVKTISTSGALSGSTSDAKATGGNAAVTGSGNSASRSGSKSTSGVNGSGNSSNTANTGISVDAADRSGGDSYTDQSKVLFIPPVVPATPPSYVGNAQIVKETSACGPLQSIVRTPVNGTFYGVFSTDKTEQGWTEDLAPYVDANGKPMEYLVRDGFGGKVFYGHQVTMFTTVVGVANARNVAIGGGGTGGNWGQGGTGTSAANQQMVTTIKLRLCEAGRTPPPPPAPPVVTTPPEQPEAPRAPKLDRE